jgi:hypothetical protein
MSCMEGTKDVHWLKKLCKELKILFEVPHLLCGNTAAIYLSKKRSALWKDQLGK